MKQGVSKAILGLGGALFLGLSLMSATTVYAAPIDKKQALEQALLFVQVKRSDIKNLKIDADREHNIPVYKVEFDTRYGDFDFAYARANGRLIDADFEIDEEYYRRLPRHNFSMTQGKAAIAKQLGVPQSKIKVRHQGNILEGEVYHNKLKHEFSYDLRYGILYDLNTELRN